MHTRIILLIIAIIGIPMAALAADLPPNWPWRGVEISSAASPSEKDIQYLASIHVNSVEIQLDTRQSAESNNLHPDVAFSNDMKLLDRLLDECKKHKMTLIISISRIPLDPKSGITQESPEFWDNAAARGEAIKIAGMLSKHFAGRGDELGAYEILNEPLVRDKNRLGRPETWPALLASIIAEIRKNDSKRYIVVTPGPAGLAIGYREFKPLNDPLIIYGMHMYEPMEFTLQGETRSRGLKYPGSISFSYWDKTTLEKAMLPLIQFQKKYGVLVWIGEFSAVRWAEGSVDYLADLIDIFDTLGWGWAYFSYRDHHGWSPFFDDKYASDKPEDWKPHYVGKETPRWKMLTASFVKNKLKPLQSNKQQQ